DRRPEMTKRNKTAAEPAIVPQEEWRLRLYIAGPSAKSGSALAPLKQLCEGHLPGKYVIEVVDFKKGPQLAREHQIVAIPTLVRQLPAPLRKIIGDLSNKERALIGLQLQDPASAAS